jgi:hypothetical protein
MSDSSIFDENKRSIRVVYGWEISCGDLPELLRLVGRIQEADELDQFEALEGTNEYDGNRYWEIYNKAFDKNRNESKNFVFYDYSMDGNNTFFGLNIKCENIGRYGEPRFGSLTFNSFDIKQLEDEDGENKRILDAAKTILENCPPKFIVLSKEY